MPTNNPIARSPSKTTWIVAYLISPAIPFICLRYARAIGIVECISGIVVTLLESREYNAEGKLEEVIVFIGERMVGLTPEGKKIDKYDDTTVDVKGFLDHFRNK